MDLQADPTETRIDPVCGMTVDLEEARADGRTMEFEDKEFAFCSEGCLLEFRQAPATYAQQDVPPTDAAST